MDIEFFENYLIKNSPKRAYYIPNYITPEDEACILRNVYNVPKPKWTCLSKRRLQDYGGVPHKNGMIPESIPIWLQTYMERISDLNIFVNKNGEKAFANHCLINEYLPGQGIMPHLDGPIFYPAVSTISCGSHSMLEFYQNSDGNRQSVCKIILEPRSLIILLDNMYEKYLHSISEIKTDTIDESCVNLENCVNKYKIGDTLQRDTRISLTIRYVPKVVKINLFNLIKTHK